MLQHAPAVKCREDHGCRRRSSMPVLRSRPTSHVPRYAHAPRPTPHARTARTPFCHAGRTHVPLIMASKQSSSLPAPPERDENGTERYDVAIVGGGAAGLSAALWLARYLHSVVLVDSGAPRTCEPRGLTAYLGLPCI